LNLITNAAKYWQHSTRGLFFANLAGAIPTIAGTLMLVIILTLNQQVWHIAGAQIVTVLYLLIRFVQALGNGALHLGLANSNWTHFKSCYLHFKGMRLENLSKVRSSRSFVKDGDMAVQHSKTEAQGSNNENSTRPRLPPEISLENVSFTYPGQDKATLSGLSMYIQAGSIFGIKGRSGAGKSTLVNLMLGILSPDSGRVRLSGTDPETYLCRSETRVGYVGPEPFLFEGSILANLLYGNPEKPSSQQIKDALEAAHLLSVIESHPQGLNHTIRGNGEGLSAGQKQRLGLARALLRQPQLLILDEASANLDETTEKIVANSIGGLKGKCTVIIISHRIGFFSHVDTLYDADTNSHENIGPNDLDSEYQAMKVT
jgi:ABC-type multidrug transport system fused ATPase/permease subunit